MRGRAAKFSMGWEGTDPSVNVGGIQSGGGGVANIISGDFCFPSKLVTVVIHVMNI